ncbi:glutaredoxin family protein [Corynebacterium aquilae]|uniref:Glutaredoxin domain-containing protein n=1 Tax=Corynebacterium aquilae DSM 44791 TaxID=1431546 RepID=A0A1L7CHL7_9CORY|nr:hypothetical protein [Corynebacterium aquilae]APT85328.1 hypothetical protein CAQU_09920 [Corynebacterium aquilae DSM 44791]
MTEPQPLTFTVFSTPHCQKCRATKQRLLRNNAPIIEETITPELADELRAKGITVAPYVQVHDASGDLLDEWGDLRLEKIAYWVGVLNGRSA